MRDGLVELVVRGVRMPRDHGRPALVMVGPCDHPSLELLSLQVGTADAHALRHELQGQPTMRSQAVCLASRIAEAMGGEVVAAHLIQTKPGLVTGMLEVRAPSGRLELRTEPGQALSAAVCLGVPLLADGRLFAPEEPPASLSGQLAEFLASLDFGDPEAGGEQGGSQQETTT